MSSPVFLTTGRNKILIRIKINEILFHGLIIIKNKKNPSMEPPHQHLGGILYMSKKS